MDREPDADHSLVELLYGELEGPARERAEARVSADPALSAELDGLRALRGTFRTCGEESDAEPPGDLSVLMAAARANARPAAVATEAPAPGLWERFSRWMAPLMAHPGLAAAATLVLVAGVAGTLYVTGGPTMVETTSAPAVAIEEAPAPVAAPTATAPAPADVTTEGAGAPAAEAESAPGRGPVVVGAAPEPVERDKARRERKADTKGKASTVAHDDLDSADLFGGEAPAKKAESTSERAGTSAPARAPAPSAKEPAAAQSPAPPAPPPPPPAPAAEPVPSSGADTAEPAPPGGELARLTRDARDAAARGDCARVRSLSARVQALDAAYHQRTFRGDKAIAACLATK